MDGGGTGGVNGVGVGSGGGGKGGGGLDLDDVNMDGGGTGGVNGVGGGGGGGRGGDEHSATAAYTAWTCDAGDPLLGHPSKRVMHASAVHA